MPSVNRLNKNLYFTEMELHLEAQFQKKGGAAELRFAKGKGLYVDRRSSQVPMRLAIEDHSYIKEDIDGMIKAGEEVRKQIKDAINREFPLFQVSGRNLGDYAFDKANNRKIDHWVASEARRIESELHNKSYSKSDIELPYNLTKDQKRTLLDKKASYNERVVILRQSLSERQKRIIVSGFDQKDFETVRDGVNKGVNLARSDWSNPEIRNLAIDHHQITRMRALHGNDPLARERAAKRHKIAEQNARLRSAIAADLKTAHRRPGAEDRIAHHIVEKFQSAPEILTTQNLNTVMGVLHQLDCNDANVKELHAYIDLEDAARDSAPYGHWLNGKIVREARGAGAFEKEVTALARKNDALLEAALHLVDAGGLSDQNRVEALTTKMMDNCTGVFRLLAQPQFQDAQEGSRAYALREKLEEQSQLTHELAQAITCPAITRELPTLQGTGTVNNRHKYDDLEEAVFRGAPYGRRLNAEILRGAKHGGALAKDVADLAKQGDIALGAAVNLVQSYAFGDEQRVRTVTDSLMRVQTDLCRLLAQAPFENAAGGSPAYRLGKKLNEQSLIMHEFAQAIAEPDLAKEQPTLQRVGLPGAMLDPAALTSGARKAAAGKRIIRDAIERDLRADPNFKGYPDRMADLLVFLLPPGKETLTTGNVAAVGELMDDFGFARRHINRLNGLVDLDRKMSTTIPQIRALNDAIGEDASAIGPLSEWGQLYFIHDDQHALTRSSELMDDAERFLNSGEMDHSQTRNYLHDALLKNIEHMDMARKAVMDGQTEDELIPPYRDVVEGISKHQAATYDLINMLRNDSDGGREHNEIRLAFPYTVDEAGNFVETPEEERPEYIDREKLNTLRDAAEPPTVLYKAPLPAAVSPEMLTTPLDNYNTRLKRVIHFFNVYRARPSFGNLANLLREVSRALTANNHVLHHFNAIDRLRTDSTASNDMTGATLIRAQQECLQELQVSAAKTFYNETNHNGVKTLPGARIDDYFGEDEDAEISGLDDEPSIQRFNAGLSTITEEADSRISDLTLHNSMTAFSDVGDALDQNANEADVFNMSDDDFAALTNTINVRDQVYTERNSGADDSDDDDWEYDPAVIEQMSANAIQNEGEIANRDLENQFRSRMTPITESEASLNGEDNDVDDDGNASDMEVVEDWTSQTPVGPPVAASNPAKGAGQADKEE